MKSITITIDLKSLCIGALGVLCVVSLSNFNKVDKPQTDPVDEIHRYQVVSDERGIVLLDTQTGKFLLDAKYSNNTRWQKGDFNTIHTGK